MSASFEPFNLTLNTRVNSSCAVSSIKARTVRDASLGESNGNSGKASFHNAPIVLCCPGCGLSGVRGLRAAVSLAGVRRRDPADAGRESNAASRLHTQKPLCSPNLGLLNKPSRLSRVRGEDIISSNTRLYPSNICDSARVRARVAHCCRKPG